MNKVSRQIVVCICLIIVSCSDSEPPQVTQQAPTVDSIPTPSCNLTVGWEPWEPYMYLAPGNRVSGLDIEIIQALALETNCDLDYVQGDWKTLLEMVADGEVDLVAGATISLNRGIYALFSDAYRNEDFVLYVRAGELSTFGTSLSAVLDAQKSFGITADYLYGDILDGYINEPYYSKLFITSDIGELNFFNLLQHQIDVVVEDPFVGAYNLNRKGISDQIKALPFTIHSGEVHMMFSKLTVSPEQVAQMNKALITIKDNNTYQAILDKYKQ